MVALFLIAILYRVLKYTILPFFFIIFSFRSFMEWKHQRGTRKHLLLSISNLIIIVIGYLLLLSFGVI
ncbi:DUF4181 domain-containing protein [Peribacillus loiseleuriae]|uniref:DUF4181 domain-containing protein n=1 Tax=Peribacillus loiseleuriae TaxID=1679170 RepID=UPI003CCC30DC